MATLNDQLKSSESCYKQLADAVGNMSKEETDNQAKMIELQRENAVLLKENTEKEKYVLQISYKSDQNEKLLYQ